MLKMERCIRYSQIIQDEEGSLSIDKPGCNICLKSTIYLDMIVHYQSEEHNQAVNYSMSQIALFLNTVSMILNTELPFPLENKFTHFAVIDFAGVAISLNIYEPYEFENALIYLYENFRVLQQHSGVDFSKVSGIFDIKSLEESPYLGRYFDNPSMHLIEESRPQKIEEPVEEDDWELLDDSDSD